MLDIKRRVKIKKKKHVHACVLWLVLNIYNVLIIGGFTSYY
jgi:hypothetical protein